MISTRDLRLLPDVARFHAAYQSMAMLDAIIMPEWQFRYYSFSQACSPDGHISIGEMQNGSGDDLFAIFGTAGCLIRGFAHEYEMSPYSEDPPRVYPGIVDDLPPDFADCRTAIHPDFWEIITFCVWRRHSDSEWHHGRIDFPNIADPDGSEFLLSAFDAQPGTYRTWAERYYQPSKFSLETVASVFSHQPLTEEIVRALNPERSLADLTEEIRQIGYPCKCA
jgi:hypothetical protein